MTNHEYTENEIKEYNKCKEDIVYFAENYVKLLDMITIKLYPYQEQILTEDRVVAKTSRRIGFSLLSQIKILHSLIFESSKTLVIYSVCMEHSMVSINNIRMMIDNLPDFLKPKLTTNNKSQLETENHSRLVGVSNDLSIRSLRINELYIEDYDFFNNSQEIISTLQVTLVDKNSKIWIWSVNISGNLSRLENDIKLNGNKSGFIFYDLYDT